MKRLGVETAILAMVAEGFLSRLSFGVIGFALPLYAQRLGMSLSAIGLLASLSIAAEMTLKPAVAPLADRFGLKRGLALAIGVRSLVGLLLALSWLPWQLFLIRIVHGASESLRDPSVNALIAEHSDRKAVASSFAWYSTAKNVAGSIGKAVGGVLLTLTLSDFKLVFVIAFLLSALPLYAVLRYVRGGAPPSEPEPSAAGPDTQAPSDDAAGRAPSLLPFAILGALISGTAAMLAMLFPILATQYAHLSEAQAGIVYLISTLVIIFAGPIFGWLSDNVSRKLVLAVRSVANTVSSLIYIAAPGFLGVASAKIVDDMGKAAFRPAWGTLMAQLSSFDRARRARTIGLMSLGENLGEFSGPLLAGFIWHTFGVTAVLGVRAGLAVLTEVYAAFLPKPAEERQKVPTLVIHPAFALAEDEDHEERS